MKLTEEERTQKLIEKIQKTAAHIGGTNKKAESRAIRALRKHTPDELAKASLDPTKFPPSDITRVLLYGTVGRMYSSTEDIQLEMRARDEFYNSLVRAARPILERYNRVVDGPQQQALRKVNESIDAKYAAKREINKGARNRVKNPAVDALDAEIKALRAERTPLFQLSKDERSANAKLHKPELDLMEGELDIKALRGVRPANLFHGNYNPATNDFKNAWKKAKF